MIGLDISLEFLWLGPTALPADDDVGEYRKLPGRRVPQRNVPSDPRTPPRQPFADIDRDAGCITAAPAGTRHYLDGTIDRHPSALLPQQGRLSGRAAWQGPNANPIIRSVMPDGGVRVDAVLLTELSASRLFGYRSYFHVPCRRPAAVVAFLKSLLPVKPVAELYTSIGKTNLFWRCIAWSTPTLGSTPVVHEEW